MGSCCEIANATSQINVFFLNKSSASHGPHGRQRNYQSNLREAAASHTRARRSVRARESHAHLSPGRFVRPNRPQRTHAPRRRRHRSACATRCHAGPVRPTTRRQEHPSAAAQKEWSTHLRHKATGRAWVSKQRVTRVGGLAVTSCRAIGDKVRLHRLGLAMVLADRQISLLPVLLRNRFETALERVNQPVHRNTVAPASRAAPAPSPDARTLVKSSRASIGVWSVQWLMS